MLPCLRFLVVSKRRRPVVATIPVAWLDAKVQEFKRFNEDVRGRERNEAFLAIVGRIEADNALSDPLAFSRQIAAIVYYLFFGDVTLSDTRRAERDALSAMLVEIDGDKLATERFNDAAEFDALIEKRYPHARACEMATE